MIVVKQTCLMATAWKYPRETVPVLWRKSKRWLLLLSTWFTSC